MDTKPHVLIPLANQSESDPRTSLATSDPIPKSVSSETTGTSLNYHFSQFQLEHFLPSLKSIK